MSAIGSSTSTQPPSSTNAFSALSSEDFIEIMVNELSHQDPLAPNDSKAILDQIASIRSIESDLSLKNSLESLVKQDSFVAAGSLIGRFAKGLTDQGDTVEGLVLSVSNTRKGAVLNLHNGYSMKMENVIEVVHEAAATLGDGATQGRPA